jgi:hypothetical protein
MKLSQAIQNIEKSQIYLSLLNGLEYMIRNAPDNDKKDMLKDVIKFGTELATTLKNNASTNEYLQAQNFKFEGLYEIEKRRVKELELLVKNLKQVI